MKSMSRDVHARRGGCGRFVVIATTIGIVASGALRARRPMSRPPLQTCVRDGPERAEPGPSNVEAASFGQIFARKLKGSIYASHWW